MSFISCSANRKQSWDTRQKMVHHLSSWCLISSEMLYNPPVRFAGSKTNQLSSFSFLTHSSQQNYSHYDGSSSLPESEKYVCPYSARDGFACKKRHFCVNLELSNLAPSMPSDDVWVIRTEKLSLYNTKARAVSQSYLKAVDLRFS